MSEETKTIENENLAEIIRESLRTVIDPELHLNVVELGLIEEVIIDRTPFVVKMLLTTPFCPYGPWLVQQIKDTSEEAAGGREVRVDVVPKRWSPEMMEDPTALGFF